MCIVDVVRSRSVHGLISKPLSLSYNWIEKIDLSIGFSSNRTNTVWVLTDLHQMLFETELGDRRRWRWQKEWRRWQRLKCETEKKEVDGCKDGSAWVMKKEMNWQRHMDYKTCKIGCKMLPGEERSQWWHMWVRDFRGLCLREKERKKNRGRGGKRHTLVEMKAIERIDNYGFRRMPFLSFLVFFPFYFVWAKSYLTKWAFIG